MQPDGGLARARAALDDERGRGIRRDQAVLVGLNRGDDVAHVALATAFEFLEQEVADGGAVDDRAVQRLVGDVDERAVRRCGTGAGASRRAGRAASPCRTAALPAPAS